MNPFLFRSHPLLHRTIELVADPSAHGIADWLWLMAIFSLLGLAWMPAFRYLAARMAGAGLGWWRAFWLDLPAVVLYSPLMLTLVGDVVRHSFRFEERWIFVFALAVAVFLLAGWYGQAIRQGRSRVPVGLETGLGLALTLLLVSIPYTLLLLGADHVFGIFAVLAGPTNLHER
jgi:hypothetical protein